MDSLAKRLRWARERAGHKTPTDAARAFGWKVSTYLGHENGDRTGARLGTIKRYAKAYKVRWEWLQTGEGPPAFKEPVIPVEGYVGAGDEFTPVEDPSPLGDAPVMVEPNSAAVKVRGHSMYPRYLDGDYIYYIKELRPPSDYLGQECVIRLTDGRMYIKVVRKGSRKGLFNLESFNGPTIEDQQIDWAAPVTWRRS